MVGKNTGLNEVYLQEDVNVNISVNEKYINVMYKIYVYAKMHVYYLLTSLITHQLSGYENNSLYLIAHNYKKISGFRSVRIRLLNLVIVSMVTA